MIQVPTVSNTVAGVASFFVPGLGQLAQGRIGAAIAFFLLCIALWFVLLGWIGQIWSALDAARWNGTASMTPVVLIVLLVFGLPLFAGVLVVALILLGGSSAAPFIYTLF